ncbi:MAG: alpha/beta hydrolase [Planctomycetota bacterium]|nr:alpha/beta hydrolase [Planctomycetota bacterium]
MAETAGYFTSADGTPLYGVFHAAEGAARPPVLIAPAFFEERKSAYGTLAGLARALAQAGHPALRFDYRGSGESGGDPVARRWSGIVADLAAARAALSKLSGREDFALLGLRLGATLALEQARALKPAATLALAPFVQGKTAERQWRIRSKLRAEMTGGARAEETGAPSEERVDLDGFPVGAEFFEDVQRVDLLAAPPLETPALLLQISPAPTRSPTCRRLKAALGARCELACLRLEPFWDRLDHVDAAALHARVKEFLGRL